MAKIATLVDDFEDGVINSSLWTPDAGITETGGQLVITPSTVYPHIITVNSYDATNSSITIQIPTVTNAGTTGSLATGAVLRLDPNNSVGFIKGVSDLLCQKKVGGVDTTVRSFAYSSTNHAWWRLREASGIFFWETSANGTAWAAQFSTTVATNLFSLSSVTFYLYAGYSGFEAAPGNARISSINPSTALQLLASGSSTSAGGVDILIRHSITAAAASTSSGSANLIITYRITASGDSTSSGSVAILIRRFLTSNATSTSSGSAAISVVSAAPLSITASGISTSAATASFIILAPGQMTAGGQSFSSGSAALSIQYVITAVGLSQSTGTAAITIYTPPVDPGVIQYFTFQPPIAYDLPPTLPNPRPRYINAHARWKGGQRRGRTVLKTGSTYRTVDSPSIDQCNSADVCYLGGHIYTVPQSEANALSAAGYTVTAITVDTTKPVLTIISPPSGANVDLLVRVLVTTSEPASLTGTIARGNTVYPITIPSTSFTLTTDDLPGGSYRITITATDAAFNSTTDHVDINIFHPGEIPIEPGLIPYPALTTYPSVSLYPGS